MFLLNIIENKELFNKNIYFNTGDIICVTYKSILNKNKLQNFTGIVIYIRNKGLNSSFLIKKNFKGINVEKVFKLFSPLIKSIDVKIQNKFKKSKLYFLRKIKNKKLNF